MVKEIGSFTVYPGAQLEMESALMIMMRWFALIAGTVWTVAIVVRMIADDSSATWQLAAIGAFLAASGLYGLLRPDEEE